jgi:hypothetical protein
MGTYKRPCGDVGEGGKVQVVVLEECFRIWFGGGVLALRCRFVLVVGGCVVTSYLLTPLLYIDIQIIIVFSLIIVQANRLSDLVFIQYIHKE